MKPLLLKLHRWIALVFALPLLGVIGTGLILAFEPLVVERGIAPGSIDAAKLVAILERHDPEGRSRSIAHRSYEGAVTISRREGSKTVDVATGEDRPGPSRLSQLFGKARGVHETLIFNARWLVVASTAAMLALAAIGVLIRWPRLSNSLPGWHMGIAWVTLPLVVLSPLTGILMAYGISLGGALPAPGPEKGGPPTLVSAIRTVGANHDLSGLLWLRQLDDRMVFRIVENGEYKTYLISGERTLPATRDWVQLWHEGNFAGAASAALAILSAAAMLGLLFTGPLMWLRARLRRRRMAAR